MDLAIINHEDVRRTCEGLLDKHPTAANAFTRLRDVIVERQGQRGEVITLTATDLLSCMFEQAVYDSAASSGILLYIVGDGATNELGQSGVESVAEKLVDMVVRGEVLEYTQEVLDAYEEVLAKEAQAAAVKAKLRPLDGGVNDGE